MPRTKSTDTSPDKERGKRLMKARKAKGLTQKQMADLFGITEQAYQHYEYGRDFKASMLVKLCTILECSPTWLLGMDDDGEHLAPEDPVMVGLRRKYDALNSKGRRKITEYADDLTCNPKYSAVEKRGAAEE